MSGRLCGKVATITGGASGMGKATVLKFAREGARVLISDIEADKGEALAAERGEAVDFIDTDVCDEGQVRAMIERASSRFGRLDCLFNNAGFGGMDRGLTAGNWTHPELAPSTLEALAGAFGVEDMSQLDMVYHARD